MINLFQMSSNDQSVFYLGQVFGQVGSLLSPTNPSLLLATLFSKMNMALLTVGIAVVIYTIIIGLFKTAQEGEFLGKSWSSMWVPLRLVFGIAGLFPTANGYCGIQIIMMWVILQGVAAADALWTTALGYVQVVGSPFSGVNTSAIPIGDTVMQLQTLFQGLVCQATAKANYPDITTHDINNDVVKYYCNGENAGSPFCLESNADMLNLQGPSQPQNQQLGTSTGDYVYYMGPNQLCGTMTYCDASQNTSDTNSQCVTFTTDATGNKIIPGSVNLSTIPCKTCMAQQAVLQQIVGTLGSIANQVTQLDNQYINFYEGVVTTPPEWVTSYCTANNIPQTNCCVVNSPSQVQAYTAAMAAYMQAVVAATTSNQPLPSAPTLPLCNAAFFNDNASDLATIGGQPSIQDIGDGTITNIFIPYPLSEYANGTDFVTSSAQQYIAALVAVVEQGIQAQIQNVQLTGWMQTAQSQGWILAGDYYFSLAQMNNSNIKAIKPDLGVQVDDPVTKPNALSNYRNNVQTASNIIGALESANGGTGMALGLPPEFSNANSAASGVSAGLLNSFISSLTGGGGATSAVTDPIISIAAFGDQLMVDAEIIFAVMITLAAVVGAVDVAVIGLGTGMVTAPWYVALKMIFGVISPIAFALMSALFSVGAMMGIYVPFIPFMVFTMGAIGWLIATIEAMVAAPIVALGILSPGGQHEILGRGEPALMLALNLFLRPMLMVFGMMASMLLSGAVISLINAGFVSTAEQIFAGNSPGLFEQIILISVYLSFIVTVLNKTFSLIYVIPEKILTWIGGPAVQYGEAEALGAAKQAVEGAASSSMGAAKESTGGMKEGGAAESSRQQGMERKAKRDAGNKGKEEGGKAT